MAFSKISSERFGSCSQHCVHWWPCGDEGSWASAGLTNRMGWTFSYHWTLSNMIQRLRGSLFHYFLVPVDPSLLWRHPGTSRTRHRWEHPGILSNSYFPDAAGWRVTANSHPIDGHFSRSLRLEYKSCVLTCPAIIGPIKRIIEDRRTFVFIKLWIHSVVITILLQLPRCQLITFSC